MLAVLVVLALTRVVRALRRVTMGEGWQTLVLRGPRTVLGSVLDGRQRDGRRPVLRVVWCLGWRLRRSVVRGGRWRVRRLLLRRWLLVVGRRGGRGTVVGGRGGVRVVRRVMGSSTIVKLRRVGETLRVQHNHGVPRPSAIRVVGKRCHVPGKV